MAAFYLIISLLWLIGAEIFIFSAARNDNPRLLIPAGIYVVVALMYGGLAIWAAR
jgi:hypothetical protein